YNIKMEYFQQTGTAEAHLSWWSSSQASNIISSPRLFPTNTTPAPSTIISPIYAVAFLGQQFNFYVTGANTPSSYTASPLPPGLGFNTPNGLLSGVPTLAGNFQIIVTSSNPVGTGASVLNLQVINTGNSGVVQEIWTTAPGATIADIPLSQPADVTNVIAT